MVLDKRAICVHAGQFESKDGEIGFDKQRIQNMVDRNNAYINQLKREYAGNPPVGAYPPVYEDHADNTRATVGRLMGPFTYEERNIPKVGTRVPCLVSECVRFLGAENCARANDGRMFHVSIGVDEAQDDLLLELSVVPEPAAPGAMLLSKGDPVLKLNKEKRMATKKESFAAIKRLSGEFKTIKTTLVKNSSDIKHLAKKQRIESELRGLVRLGKMTPAEFRLAKMDEMAKLDDSAFGLVRDAYKNRNDVIQPGQIGTTDGLEAGAMAKEIGHKRLAAETKAEMKRLGAKINLNDDEKKLIGKKRLSAMEKLEKGGEDKDSEKQMSDGYADSSTKEMSGPLGEMEQHLEAGDIEKAKECMKHLKKMSEDGGKKDLSSKAEVEVPTLSEAPQQKLAELEEQVGQLTSVVERMSAELENMVQAEEDEGHEELAEGGENEEEKHLEEGAKDDEEKKDEKHLEDAKKDEGEEKKLGEPEDKKEDEKHLQSEARKDMGLAEKKKEESKAEEGSKEEEKKE